MIKLTPWSRRAALFIDLPIYQTSEVLHPNRMSKALIWHRSASDRRFNLSFVSWLAFWILLAVSALPAFAQSSLSDVIGIPNDAAIYPIPGVGFVNLTNGNLHVEIPLWTVNDRNGQKRTTAIVADNSIWEWLPCPNQGCSEPNGWATVGAPYPQGGGYASPLSINADGYGQLNYLAQTQLCGSADQTTYSQYSYTDSHGTIHPFPAGVLTTNTANSQCFNSTAQVAAADGSGYWLAVTSAGTAVYDMHGNVVTPGGPDTNGNIAPKSFADKLGQSLLPLPAGFSIQSAPVYVYTKFGDASLAEQKAYSTPISSITLPDGRTYQFTYDDAGSSYA